MPNFGIDMSRTLINDSINEIPVRIDVDAAHCTRMIWRECNFERLHRVLQ